MICEKCGADTHRDDAMERRCNPCERLVRLCSCKDKIAPSDYTVYSNPYILVNDYDHEFSLSIVHRETGVTLRVAPIEGGGFKVVSLVGDISLKASNVELVEVHYTKP